jgi:RHS repeat-associated protein
MIAAIAASYGLSGGVNEATKPIYDAFEGVLGDVVLYNQQNTEVPKAFINYIFFDKNYDNYYFGARQISSAAKGNFEKLTLSTPSIDEEGYLYIYVSNESNLPVNIYFDDLEITHTSSASMLQADDFYAFGLVIDDFHQEKEDVEPNRFLYQGKEWIDEEDQALAMYDFHARLYDPALGRFMGVDPQGQFASPYMAMGNNPMIMVDPDGEFAFVPLLVAAAVGAGISSAGYTASVAMSDGGFDNWNWGKFGISAGIGAISGVATYGIGSAFGSVGTNGLGGEIGRAMAHGMSNTTITAAFGGEVNAKTYAIGALSSLAGSGLHFAPPIGQISGSALVGGVTSEISGEDFWKGAATGAIIGTLNHVKHRIEVGLHVKAVRAFLEDAGFSQKMVKSDIIMQSSSFFSRAYARFVGNIDNYGDYFTGGQWDSFKGTHDAYVSESRSMKYTNHKNYALMKSLSVKYYPSRDHSIGLVQSRYHDHFFEGGLELIDGKIREWTGKDNTIYDMHGRNSAYYLKWRRFFN